MRTSPMNNHSNGPGVIRTNSGMRQRASPQQPQHHQHQQQQQQQQRQQSPQPIRRHNSRERKRLVEGREAPSVIEKVRKSWEIQHHHHHDATTTVPRTPAVPRKDDEERSNRSRGVDKSGGSAEQGNNNGGTSPANANAEEEDEHPFRDVSLLSYSHHPYHEHHLHDAHHQYHQQHHHAFQYQNGALLPTTASKKQFYHQRQRQLKLETAGGGGGGGNGNKSAGMVAVRLEDYHTTFRAPLHVPDSRYGAYLRGQSGRRKRSSSVPSFVTQKCCAQACAGFSLTGMLFLLFVGILFDTQPLYIRSSLTLQVVYTDDASKPVMQYLIPHGKHGERLPTATSAYHAALAYLVTLLISLVVAYPERLHELHKLYRRHGQRYQDIPDHESMISTTSMDSTHVAIHHNYNTNSQALPGAAAAAAPTSGGGVDLHLNSNGKEQPLSPNPADAYRTDLWGRSTAWMKHRLAVRGWWGVRKFRRKEQKLTV